MNGLTTRTTLARLCALSTMFALWPTAAGAQTTLDTGKAALVVDTPDHSESAKREAAVAPPKTNKGNQALAVSAWNSGDYVGAERAFRAWLASESSGSEGQILALNGLGHLLREEGRSAEARQMFMEVTTAPNVESYQKLSGLMGLADVDMDTGALQASIGEWNTALELARRQSDVRWESAILRELGRTWVKSGSAARAEPLLRRSLSLAESSEPDKPLEIAASLDALAEYYRAVDKLALAEDTWLRALKIERAQLGDEHPVTALSMGWLAGVYLRAGQIRSGVPVRRARGGRNEPERFGDVSPPAAVALANLAWFEQHASKLDSRCKSFAGTAINTMLQFPELRTQTKAVMQSYEGILKTLHRDHEAKALDVQIRAFR